MSTGLNLPAQRAPVDAVLLFDGLRYLPGQRLYRDQCAPAQRAGVVIDTSDGG